MQPKFSKWEKKGEPLLEFRVIWTDEVFEISSESLESHENPHQNLLVRAQPTSLCHCLGTWFKDFLMENIEFWPNWTWVCCELGLENFIWAFFTIMYLKGHSWYWKRPMKIFPESNFQHTPCWTMICPKSILSTWESLETKSRNNSQRFQGCVPTIFGIQKILPKIQNLWKLLSRKWTI